MASSEINLQPGFIANGSRTDFEAKISNSSAIKEKLLRTNSEEDSASDSIVGIEKNEKAEMFIVYPNPSDGYITIENLDRELSFEIFTSYGKRISFFNLNKEESKSFTLSNGVYIVIVKEHNLLIQKETIIIK